MRRASIAVALIASLGLTALPAHAVVQAKIADFVFTPSTLTVAEGRRSRGTTSKAAARTSRRRRTVRSTCGTPGPDPCAAHHRHDLEDVHDLSRDREADRSRVRHPEEEGCAGAWTAWMTGVTALLVRSRHLARRGTWWFRSHVHRISNGARSGWSPPRRITIS